MTNQFRLDQLCSSEPTEAIAVPITLFAVPKVTGVDCKQENHAFID